MSESDFCRPLAAPLGLTSLLGIYLPAQTLIHDFNPNPGLPQSSQPRSFQVLPNGKTLFLAFTPTNGDALWLTDGTAAGTTLLVDLGPGPAGPGLDRLVPLGNGSFVFAADLPGSGGELWRTDGTANGTVLLADINPGGAPSHPRMFTRVGNQVVFAADNGTNGAELWATDGTAAGTRMIRDLVAGPGSSVGSGLEVAAIGAARFVFVGPFDNRLWVSDFTSAGTQPIGTGTGFTTLRSFGNLALFRSEGLPSQNFCWVSDGTAAGTFSLGVVTAAGSIQIAGNQAFFRGWTNSNGWELWRTDGTIAGTYLVVDLLPSTVQVGSSPWFIGARQNDVLFFANTTAGQRLFRSDGTAAGTVAISNIANSGTFHGSDWGTSVQGWLYYTIQSTSLAGGPAALHRTDGTPAGTTLVANFPTGAEIGVVGNSVLFRGDDGTGFGTELWTSGGTAASTQLLRDLAPGNRTEASYPQVVGTFRDRALVRATTAASGNEVWITDGTAAGTQQLVDLAPGPASSNPAIAVNDRQMMIVPGWNDDPWFSDGTPAGTAQRDLFPANWISTGPPAAFGDRFVFAGNLPGLGNEPWITDGTVAGTSMLLDIEPGAASSTPAHWLRFGAHMLFSVTRANGVELWITDGTTAGTLMLGSLGPYGYFSSLQAIALDGIAYYAGYSPTTGSELFATDGTVAGTGLLADLDPGIGTSRPFGFTAIGSRLLFLAQIGTPWRLFALDGSTGVVTALNATNPGRPWTVNDTTAVFFSGTQLWRTDGTDAGTSLVRTFTQVAGPPLPQKLGTERLVFVASDGYTGIELWSTDGTAAGTMPISSFLSGQPGIDSFRRAGSTVVLVGDDGIHGQELMALPFVQSGDWVFERYGSGCPGTGGITPAIDYTGAARVTTAPPFTLNLTGARPSSLALLALGWQRGAVPIPGCTLWLDSAAVLLTVPTDLAGTAAVPFALPPAALGTRFTGQWFALDPAGAAFGLLAATAAAEVVVGP
jgi:ELWxxDGT repeat protein